MGFGLRGDEISITYQPFKEIVILDKTRFNSPDDLARFASIISGGKPSGLYWAEGVLILYFLLPSSTNTAAKELVEESCELAEATGEININLISLFYN